MMVNDQDLRWLIEQAHSAIFQWVAFALGSGIGMLQILQIITTDHTYLIIWTSTYIGLLLLLWFSSYNIIVILKKQTLWIQAISNRFIKNEINESRQLGNIIGGSGLISLIIDISLLVFIILVPIILYFIVYKSIIIK